jgi:hypothetical protein
MRKAGRIAAIVGLAMLGACARLVDDPFAVHNIYQGLTPNPVYRGELPRVLYSDPEVPDKQGLLYTSMFESEVAAQYSGLAVTAERPSEAQSQLEEVLYAIDPAVAPPNVSTPTASGWAGAGYGARRATGELAAAIRNGVASDGSAALRQYGPEAAGCADNTLHRADQVATLSQQALEGPAEQSDLLQQIHDIARQLLRGSDAGTDPATCGLEQTKRDLDPLAQSPGPGY